MVDAQREMDGALFAFAQRLMSIGIGIVADAKIETKIWNERFVGVNARALDRLFSIIMR
jgi:hypothetical protein